jgi:hypothetical protein
VQEKKVFYQSTKKGNLLVSRKLAKTTKLKQEVLMNEVDGIRIEAFRQFKREIRPDRESVSSTMTF